MAAGKEGDRHRQFLCRLDALQRRDAAGRLRCPLREGLTRTLAYYREHMQHYLDETTLTAPPRA